MADYDVSVSAQDGGGVFIYSWRIVVSINPPPHRGARPTADQLPDRVREALQRWLNET